MSENLPLMTLRFLPLLISFYLSFTAGYATVQETQSGGLNSQTKVEIAQPSTFPEVVARINDVTIGKNELLERVKAVQAQINAPAGPTPLGVYRLVLNELIDLELLYQASISRQLTASEEDVETEFRDLKSNFATEEEFQSQLDQSGINAEQLKEIFKKDLSVKNLVETEYGPRVSIDDEMKLSFYNENRDQMMEPQRLRIRHILVSVDGSADQEKKDAAKTKIVELRRQILDGEANFAELAELHSDDTESKSSGGELIIARGQTVPEFEEAAFQLFAGAVSDIVETPYGYHIIELLERLPEKQLPFEEVEPMIERYLRQEQLQKVIDSEVKVLRESAEIEIFI